MNAARLNPEFQLPRVEIFGCSRAGVFVRFMSLAQYARARSTLHQCEIFNVHLSGSLVTDALRAAAIVRGGGVAGSLRDGGGDGADFSATPDGNNGDNLTNLADKVVL